MGYTTDTTSKIFRDCSSSAYTYGIGTNWGNNSTISLNTDNINLNGFTIGTKTISDAVNNYQYNTWTGNYTDKDKKDKTMNNFNFGPAGDRARISHLGIAVKNTNGEWVSYDADNNEIVNVDAINFGKSDFVYMIPVSVKEVKKGDVILHNKQIMFVKRVKGNEIKAVDITNGEYKVILPTKSIFGFDFITKLVSLFDMFGGPQASEDNPFGNILPFMLMNGATDNLPLLMMMMMQRQGGENTAPIGAQLTSIESILPMMMIAANK